MATEDIQYAYAGDIVKAEKDPVSGNLMVFGKATGPTLDLDEQVADPEWLKKAMPDWAKWGNLREMHQPIVAGIGKETSTDEHGNWFLKSEVIDAGTARKIEAGALKGYSIGIKNARVVKDASAPGGRIVGGTIVEVSYVDRPCNPDSVLGIAKAVGADNVLAGVDAAPGTAWLKSKAPKADKVAEPVTWENIVARLNELEKTVAASRKKNPKFGASGHGKDSGGRDVSDLDAADFAGPDGTFPIKNRDDVSDAASLAHHAADPAAVKAKIRAIAKRKFQMKDNEMPDSLKDAKPDADCDADDMPVAKKKSKKAKKPGMSKKAVSALVKATVADETTDLRARAEKAEEQLATLSKTVVPGGPRPFGYAPKTDDVKAKAALASKYRALAAQVSDRDQQRGYTELAKKVEADLAK